jgi:hypothetical protein
VEINRREMMTSATAFATLAYAINPRAFAQAVQNAPHTAVDVAGYWSSFYDDTIATKGPNQAALASPKRKTLYLHSPDSGKPIVYAENIPTSALPAIDGDVLVKMAVSQYRPGTGDISTDVSHLRIDAAQTFDYMNLIAPLTWATIASITPDKKVSKLPTIDKLGFKEQAAADTTNLKQLTLPSGVGKMAVNVTRPSDPKFTEAISISSTVVTSVLSMMTVPAISVPAIKVFSALLGRWQSHATVIMNGNLTPVIATSVTPPGTPMPQSPMPLPSGYFIMFPEQHKDALTPEFDKLILENGFLVHKDAPASQDLVTRAQDAVPGVSYASLRIYCDKAPANGCNTANKPTTGTKDS